LLRLLEEERVLLLFLLPKFCIAEPKRDFLLERVVVEGLLVLRVERVLVVAEGVLRVPRVAVVVVDEDVVLFRVGATLPPSGLLPERPLPLRVSVDGLLVLEVRTPRGAVFVVVPGVEPA